MKKSPSVRISMQQSQGRGRWQDRYIGQRGFSKQGSEGAPEEEK